MDTVENLKPPSAAALPAVSRGTVGLPKQPAEGGFPLPEKATDISGRRFGRLVVLRFSGLKPRYRDLRWVCRCDCGNERIVSGNRLRAGLTRSCGCFRRERIVDTSRKKLNGLRFGRLEVRAYDHTKNKKAYWSCKCDCGRTAVVSATSLLAGNTKSCGCLQRDRTRETSRKDLAGARFGRLVPLFVCGRRGSRLLWTCRCDCGKQVQVAGSDLLSGHTRSCGCLKVDTLRRARLNPLLTAEDRQRRRLGNAGAPSGTEIAQKVMRRDRYTCLSCGTKGGRLAAHHIFPWAGHRKLRYTLANLVTLCDECHKQFHSIYGNDCDLDGLEEYLTE